MRRLWFTLLIVVVLALVVAFFANWVDADDEAVWTTESPRAREALDLALDALMKRYMNDAVRHLDRALELDPGFAMARLYRDWVDPEVNEAQKLEHLRNVDLGALSERERVMVQAWRSYFDGDSGAALESMKQYLDRHPDDPYIRFFVCDDAWDRLAWQEAERCYQDLIERHPNWVEAQNRLGYLALAEGQFQMAEDRFEAYRFVAPDQANPYDSLAELALLRGRLDTAAGFLAEALEIRPDFCDALLHRVQLETFRGDFAAARAALDEVSAEASCRGAMVHGARCLPEVRIAYLAGDYEAAWQASEACPEERVWYAPVHRAALITGRRTEAEAIAATVQAMLDDQTKTLPPTMRAAAEGVVLNFEGSKLFAAGRFAEAASRFGAADARNRYWGWKQGWVFKLFNQVDWSEALARAGDQAESARVAARLAEVNPIIDTIYRPGIVRLASLP